MPQEVRVRGVFHAGAARRARRILGPIATFVGSVALAAGGLTSIVLLVDGPFGVLAALSVWAFVLGGFLIPSIAPFVMANARPRPIESDILCAPGRVRVVDVDYTILARDVVGASTALHEGGYLLSVDSAETGRPHALWLPDAESLDRVRRALGLEHEGTGVVEWAVGRSPELWFGVGAVLSNFLCAGLALPMLLVWPFLRLWPRQWRSATRLALTPGAVKYQPGTHWLQEHAYTHIEEAVYDAGTKTIALHRVQRLRFDAWGPPASPGTVLAYLPVSGLGADEARQVCAQINAAAVRARGDRVARSSALDRIALIRRLDGENARSWLARIGALAASVGAEGYRSAPIEAEDLQRVAEDPDEAAEDRVAAGRMFLRATSAQRGVGPEDPGVRVRVDAALATLRARPERVRLALDAPEDAAGDAIEEIAREKRLRMAP